MNTIQRDTQTMWNLTTVEANLQLNYPQNQGRPLFESNQCRTESWDNLSSSKVCFSHSIKRHNGLFFVLLRHKKKQSMGAVPVPATWKSW